MSELQLGLLAIGVLVVLGLAGYNAWQRRKYQRKFGATFESQRPDVLHQETVEMASPPVMAGGEEPKLDLDALDADPVLEELEAAPLFVSDSLCELIEGASDYVATLTVPTPQSCDFLGALWDKRFVFGKNVVVCGLGASHQGWERIVPESRANYSTFRIALQLVDRHGATTETRLGSFNELMRQLAQQINAELDMVEVADAQKQAVKLDEFCAGADQLIGINIRIKEGKVLFASDVEQIVQLLNFSLQADGKFHLLDAHGRTLFTLGDSSEMPFQHHTLNQTRVSLLTLLLDVPRVELPVARFDQMATLAQELADELKGTLIDDNGRELNSASIVHIQSQVRHIEADMLAGGVPPGSPQALRLFA